MMIFNMKQANYLIRHNATVLGSGYGKRDGSPYIYFEVNDAFDKAMDEWRAICRLSRLEEKNN